MTAFDTENLSHDQGIGHNASRLGKNPAEGLAGYVHPHGGVFLIQSFKIAKPDGFQALNGKNNLFSSPRGQAVWEKSIHNRAGMNKSKFWRSGHFTPSFFNYEHLIII
jgi:hypothetical protein